MAACAKEEEKPKSTAPAENRIVSLAEVQKFMAATHPPAPVPVPPPAPVEKEETPVKPPKPAPPRPGATATQKHGAEGPGKLASRSKTVSPIATPTVTPPVAAAPAPAAVNANLVAPPTVAAPTPVSSPDNAVVPALATNASTTAVVNAALYVDESRIYTKEDHDVVPARLLTTPSNSGLSTTTTDVNTMELVISKLGRVEEARLTVPPKRMTDMLLLSGAKMWKFTPAMKDGQPVRYRTQVSWETTR
jgi:hypothetical protein